MILLIRGVEVREVLLTGWSQQLVENLTHESDGARRRNGNGKIRWDAGCMKSRSIGEYCVGPSNLSLIKNVLDAEGVIHCFPRSLLSRVGETALNRDFISDSLHFKRHSPPQIESEPIMRRVSQQPCE